MTTPADLLFVVSLSLLIIHELDAIRQREWRFFPIINRLPDEAAYAAFTALHVPLLVWILWSMPDRGFQIGMSLFIIGHAALHFALRHHPALTFNSTFSRAWIFGAVPFSAAHLLLVTVS